MIGEQELQELFKLHEGHPMDLTGTADTGVVGACVRCGEFVVAGVATIREKEAALDRHLAAIAKVEGLPLVDRR